MSFETTLILDTSLPDALLALYHHPTDRVWELRDSQPRSSERLHGHLHDLLAQAGITLADVDRVVVTRGPGSFTGIRVGLAVAQALTMAQQTPVLTLTTLTGLAVSHPAAGPVTVVIDSLGQEVFVQTFGADATPLDEPQCLAPDEAHVYLADKGPLVGNGAAKLGLPAAPHLLDARTLATTEHVTANLQPLYLKPLNYRKIVG